MLRGQLLLQLLILKAISAGVPTAVAQSAPCVPSWWCISPFLAVYCLLVTDPACLSGSTQHLARHLVKGFHLGDGMSRTAPIPPHLLHLHSPVLGTLVTCPCVGRFHPLEMWFSAFLSKSKEEFNEVLYVCALFRAQSSKQMLGVSIRGSGARETLASLSHEPLPCFWAFSGARSRCL